MTVIHVPRPSPEAHNPDRPASSLLLAQIEHLHNAERDLPLRYRSKRYIRAIKTEGEAAEYIQHVTEAIHQAHADAAAERERRGRRKPKRGIAIAAAAAPARSKRAGTAKAKSSRRGQDA